MARVKLYRRHHKDCPHAKKGGTFDPCKCPIWVQGSWAQQRIRKSLDVNSWAKAEELKSQIEHGEEKDTSTQKALDAFYADCQNRNLAKPTLANLRRLVERLRAFTADHQIKRLGDFTPDALRDFRASWTFSPRSAQKELERLRAFFKFCQESGWVQTNPAKSIETPQVKTAPRRIDQVRSTRILYHFCTSDSQIRTTAKIVQHLE